MTKIDRIGLPSDLKRRNFLIGSGAAGLAFGYVAVSGVQGVSDALAAGKFEPTAWYSIAPDGKITVMVGKAEMGQHVSSAMAQIVAEELEADWRMMNIQLVDNDPKYNDPVLAALITGGSWSVRMNFDAMSRAGAAGRITLIDAGAAMMGVPASECRASNSQVIHTKTGKKVSYAKIVSDGKASKVWTADELKAIKLKTPGQYTLVGQSVPQLDIPPKTNGTAKYGIDAMVPGMLYGKPVVPPVRYGAKVAAVDDSTAKQVKGFVKAVTLDDKTGTTSGWVVAVATTYDAAKKAAEALKIAYDKGPYANVSDQTLIDEAKRLQKTEGSGQLFVKKGDEAAAIAGAAKVLEAEYLTSINIHAPLEPMNALAYEKDGVWHIHTGNQFASRTGGIAAGALGVDPKNVVLHQYFIGGGFGRRLDADMVIPAVLASKAVAKPVKLIYAPRRRHGDGFHPAAHLPEGEGRARRRRQAGRPGARRRLRLADRALGHPGVPHARGRQEGPARQLHGERRGLLVHRAQPSGPRHPERAGAEGDAVRPASLGGAGLDLLGGRKHDRRARPCCRARTRSTSGSRCSTARATTRAAPRSSPMRCAPPSAVRATAPQPCPRTAASASPA